MALKSGHFLTGKLRQSVFEVSANRTGPLEPELNVALVKFSLIDLEARQGNKGESVNLDIEELIVKDINFKDQNSCISIPNCKLKDLEKMIIQYINRCPERLNEKTPKGDAIV